MSDVSVADSLVSDGSSVEAVSFDEVSLALSSLPEHAANSRAAVTSRGRVRRIATTLLAKSDRPTSTIQPLTER